METLPRTTAELTTEIQSLQARLREAEETLRAIREGEVDALVVSEHRGEKVYTLKSADRSYRLMIEGMRQGAVSLTADGQILYCNQGFADLLKLPLDRVIDSPIGRFVAPELHPLLAALLREGWAGGSSQGEAVLLAADGSRVPVFLAFNALAVEESVYSLLLVVTDLTEQKRIEELRLLHLAKDQFLANLSHELRTPLAPVMAVIARLEGDGRLPPDVNDDLAMIHRNVELEARLIDDLLDATRIARGSLELQCRITELGQVLAEAIDTCCAQEVASGRRSVIQELTAPNHLAWADPARLSQVFRNLLTNAVKFTPEGGTIRIRTWSEPNAGLAAQRVLVVEVADTGMGIRADLLPKIFQRFRSGGARDGAAVRRTRARADDQPGHRGAAWRQPQRGECGAWTGRHLHGADPGRRRDRRARGAAGARLSVVADGGNGRPAGSARAAGRRPRRHRAGHVRPLEHARSPRHRGGHGRSRLGYCAYRRADRPRGQ